MFLSWCNLGPSETIFIPRTQTDTATILFDYLTQCFPIFLATEPFDLNIFDEIPTYKKHVLVQIALIIIRLIKNGDECI